MKIQAWQGFAGLLFLALCQMLGCQVFSQILTPFSL